MLKIYKNGEEFLNDNLSILNDFPIETAFFKYNAKNISSFSRYNYCFKLYDDDSYLIVLKMDPYKLLLFVKFCRLFSQ